jgi:hypothetical protein
MIKHKIILKYKTMEEKINNLGTDNNFTFVDLNISDKEKSLIEKLEIKATNEYNRFGNLQALNNELPTFLHENGNIDKEINQAIAEIIARTAKEVIKATKKETAWVCVRSFTPTNEYNIPRWHIDGYYYPPYSGLIIKFVATLKGKHTLLYKLEKNKRNEFNLKSNDRQTLSKFLNINKSESPKNGYGILYIVGDNKTAAIHSEPEIREERLFFSILPGNMDEITDLYSRWNPNNSPLPQTP